MSRTRAERKARNTQRRQGREEHRSQLAAGAVAELEAWAARAETYAAIDALEVACERCGLEIVDSGPFAWWRRDLDEPFAVCVVCGCATATFVRHVEYRDRRPR